MATAAGPALRRRPLTRVLQRLEELSCEPADNDETRFQKALFTAGTIVVYPAGLLWGLLYAVFDAPLAAVIPPTYTVLSALNLAVLVRTRRFPRFRRTQLALILLLPVMLHLSLGGFVASSSVILWSLLAPLGALVFRAEESRYWFAAFAAAIVLVGLLGPEVSTPGPLPSGVVLAFFILNPVAVCAVSFGMMLFLVQGRQRLRELERAYLEQEVMLRQSEKLATLGTLAAGVAHELNNPAAAAQRGAGQLRPAYEELQAACVELAASELEPGQLARLLEVDRQLRARGTPGGDLDTLERSDREADIERWLEAHGVPDAWLMAPDLVDASVTEAELDGLVGVVGVDAVGLGASWIARSHAVDGSIRQITEGAGRIAAIVAALRSYTYLDRDHVQLVDVTEGLDSTLVLLSNKLKGGVHVVRQYAADIPRVVGHGSELNQVWTNLIDNAVAAMDGVGTLTVRANGNLEHVTVEVEDTGMGMPSEVAARVFDPFFTTKPPGQGTGLGLNISHGIVVNKHAGTIAVAESRPGKTVFRVVLPVAPTAASAVAPDGGVEPAVTGRPV